MQEGSSGGRIAGYFRLLRVGNCAMAAFGALLAAIICAGLDGTADSWLDVILSMLIVIMFTGAGNSLNDYYDRQIDKTAHPERPLPTGLVTPKQVFAFAAVLFALAQIVSVFVGVWSFGIVAASIAVMVAYEKLLKAQGLPGNMSISWLTGALFLFGGAAVDKMELAWVLALLAFLATLGREIIKDIQDIEGDRGTRNTFPMRVGVKKAGALASAAFFGAVALSPVPYLWDMLSGWYVPAVAVADGIFIYCALIHIGNPERGQKVAKLAMFVALIAFLLGGVL
jgi:geranylgeranylglycerol-phosphate geranylgeranyltransferase